MSINQSYNIDWIDPPQMKFRDHVKGLTLNEMLAIVYSIEGIMDNDLLSQSYRKDAETARAKLKGELIEAGIYVEEMKEVPKSLEMAWKNFLRIAEQSLDAAQWKKIAGVISLVEKVLELDFVEPIQTSLEPLVMEPSSYCPVIPEADEMMERTEKYLQEHPNAEDWNIQGDGAEIASIGHDYTFHTHPRGTAQPSEADIKTTKSLKKDYLCIGLVPTGEIVCYDMRDMSIACEHDV